MESTPVAHGELNRRNSTSPVARGKRRADHDPDISLVPVQKHRKPPKKQLPHNVTYACPFFKKDSVTHRRCATNCLLRTQDFKQHLYRHHCKPEYCPKCYTIFGKDNATKDLHVRAGTCQTQPPMLPAGVSGMQKDQLSKPVKYSLSPDEQWYSIWDIVFPNETRPLSPYLNTEIDDQLKIFREFTITFGPAIFRQTINSHGLELNFAGYAGADDEALLEKIIAAGQEEISGIGLQAFSLPLTHHSKGGRNLPLRLVRLFYRTLPCLGMLEKEQICLTTRISVLLISTFSTPRPLGSTMEAKK